MSLIAANLSDSESASVRDNASLSAEVDSLWVNINQQAGRIRQLEKVIDTRNTPLWKRIIFRIDGWSSWTVVDKEPRWRPWRRWWRS